MHERRRDSGRKLCCASLLAAGLALLAGSCSTGARQKPTFPVKGQVFYEGRPTPRALVIFHPLDDPDPEAPRPRGRVEDDGTFTLTTYRAHDGAPVGRYAVTVHWPQRDAEGETIEGTSLIPRRYESPSASALKAEIQEGANDLPPFQLKR